MRSRFGEIIFRIDVIVHLQIFDLEIPTLHSSTLGARREYKTRSHVGYTVGTGFGHRKLQKYPHKNRTHEKEIILVYLF